VVAGHSRQFTPGGLPDKLYAGTAGVRISYWSLHILFGYFISVVCCGSDD